MVNDAWRLGAGAAIAAALALPALAQEQFAEAQESCVACHGAEAAEDVPHLGGIDSYYALLQLVAFRSGQRKSEVMNGVVEGFSDDDLRAAAEWIDGLERPDAGDGSVDPATVERAQALADEHRCNTCHGSDYLGGEQIPPLRNQREAYLLKSLQDYKASRRIGDRAAMVEVAEALSDEDIETLAAFLAHME